MWRVLLLAMSLGVCTVVGMDIQLLPGTGMMDGILEGTGSTGGLAVVKQSGQLNAGERGLTISAAVRLSSSPKIAGKGLREDGSIIYHMDVIASKGGEFVFGRRKDAWVDQMYLNFQDGTEWKVPLKLGGKSPRLGEWNIWTVTILPRLDAAQGERSTTVNLYLNGELAMSHKVKGIPSINAQPVVIGSGKGILGDDWGFKGSLAEITILPKALDDEAVQDLVAQSKLVQVSFRRSHKLTSGLEAAFASEEATASPLGIWMLASLRRAVRNGLEESIAFALLKENAALWREDEAVSVASKLGNGLLRMDGGQWRSLSSEQRKRMLADAGRPALRLFLMREWEVLLLEGKAKGISPLLGIRERTSGRELFGSVPIAWKLEIPNGKNLKVLDAGEMAWTCLPLNLGKDEVSWIACWQFPEGGMLYTTMAFFPDRAVFALDALELAEKLQPVNVRYPIFRFARKGQGRDYLVHPVQGGSLIPDPVHAGLPNAAWYPSGQVTMQFGAYYDDASGVYFSPEDPEFGIFRYDVTSRGENLQVQWCFPQVRKEGASLCARAVLRPYHGDWFDASQLYKRHFAIPFTRPRKSPLWLEQNCFWLAHWTFKDADIGKMPALMAGIRDFMELPMAVHWYRWVDGGQGGWPHFNPKNGVLQANEEMLKRDVRTVAYIDTRLWSELDGPFNKSDWEYTAKGRPSAALNWDGSVNKERYRAACDDVVMCPNAFVWQRAMADSCVKVAKAGFAGIYHDQVAAARPFPCYPSDTVSHGHLPGDPHAWLQGYRAMFKLFDSELASFPEIVATTEDASDAYMNLFDAFLPWRWTQDNPIPLFASVYGGRTQFVGRVYDNSSKGSSLSHFIKASTQLLNGEQLGWFTYSYLKRPDFALFVKRLCHVRNALLGTFNGGDMERPVTYRTPPEMNTTEWGVAAKTPRPVTMPAILSASWGKGGKSVILFVNPSKSVQHAVPLVPKAGHWRVCRMDGSVTELAPGSAVPLALPPQSLEIWSSDADEARRLASELKRISEFGTKLKILTK